MQRIRWRIKKTTAMASTEQGWSEPQLFGGAASLNINEAARKWQSGGTRVGTCGPEYTCGPFQTEGPRHEHVVRHECTQCARVTHTVQPQRCHACVMNPAMHRMRSRSCREGRTQTCMQRKSGKIVPHECKMIDKRQGDPRQFSKLYLLHLAIRFLAK